MLTDGALELTRSDWGKTCLKHSIIQNTTEPHTPKINPAESQGGILKRRIRHIMRSTNTPVRLWDYAWEYASSIRSLTATTHIQNLGVTAFETVLGYTPNISEYIQHKWFDWVWFNDPDDPDKQRLGRWLGPAHSVGQGMAFHVLTHNGNVMTRSTVVSLSRQELENDSNKIRMVDYTKSMESTLGNYSHATSKLVEYKNDDPYKQIFEGDADIEEIEYISPNDSPYHDDFVENPSVGSTDKILGIKLSLPSGGEQLEGKTIHRKRDSLGNLIGTEDSNPSQDTRMYDVDFGDGNYGSYSANTIIENLHAQVDDYGQTSSLLQGIINFRMTDEAIPKSRGWTTLPSGVKKRKVTTKGVELEVEFIDGTSSWVPLKDLKESNPIETAEFAVSRQIQDEPAFAWWVTHVLRKRTAIIKRVNMRTAKKSMKFGIFIPNDIDHARKLDEENGNTFWEDAIQKEVANVKIAFQLLEHNEPVPVASKLISYHFIFDVKFDLTRKARCVAGGHQNKNVPAQCTYASVVSRDSVRIAFLLAALNEVDILAGDVGNAYLNAPAKERVHVTIKDNIFGPENKGKTAVIVRALYGLKSAGNSWRQHFATKIREELGYQPCEADQDVYMKEATKPDGTKYWAYIIVYVDDVLCVNHDTKSTMDLISNLYRMKEGSIETPKVYLGANIKEWKLQDADGEFIKCYASSSNTYAKEAVRIVEGLMLKNNLSFSSTRRQGSKTPFSSSDYRPELENTPYCNDEHTTVYQNLMGMLRWMCELGRIDILHESSLLSQYMAAPRSGHLQQAVNVFKYIKHNLTSGWLIFDPLDFDINWVPIRPDELHPTERAKSMKELYPDSEDLLPPKIPEPRGKPVNINIFVDSDHAGNVVTRRSHTGIMMFVNMAPIQWYSKKQNTIESSTFGAEFIALKIATELIKSLQYKLRMMGVPLSGHARVMCDNQSVVISGSFPESTLKKKHCSIAYHKVREAIAAGKILIFYENTETNIADLFTKVLTANKRWPLIQGVLS